MEEFFKSQHGQDKLVAKFFGPSYKGFFLELGAGDGVDLSNTYYFEKVLGWDGICIEAVENNYKKLINNRTCVCLNECVSSGNDEEYFVEADLLGGLLKFFALDRAKRVNEECPHAEIVTKQCTTLRKILDKYCHRKQIDYFSLDTEGSELELLLSFPFDDYRILWLTVEHNYYTDIRNGIHELMLKNNFNYVCSIGCDDVYVNREISEV